MNGDGHEHCPLEHEQRDTPLHSARNADPHAPKIIRIRIPSVGRRGTANIDPGDANARPAPPPRQPRRLPEPQGVRALSSSVCARAAHGLHPRKPPRVSCLSTPGTRNTRNAPRATGGSPPPLPLHTGHPHRVPHPAIPSASPPTTSRCPHTPASKVGTTSFHLCHDAVCIARAHSTSSTSVHPSRLERTLAARSRTKHRVLTATKNTYRSRASSTRRDVNSQLPPAHGCVCPRLAPAWFLLPRCKPSSKITPHHRAPAHPYRAVSFLSFPLLGPIAAHETSPAPVSHRCRASSSAYPKDERKNGRYIHT
ncbi:hypothetical protein B0H16DRAFT_1786715 [Mycena metata]|uniref:Uncharacterized protein n=1 Tax=Mycena metata TaxID=1033252 RepID=A0AAD7MM12_9AGAR|nr:hypothetical protein B0H16DRAFT_1786715 [Mycena metata]